MAKNKKFTRKQLLKEPDEFITTTGKLIRFARAYQKPLAYGVGALMVALLIIAGWRYYTATREKQAFASYEQAAGRYAAAVNTDGVQKAYADVQQDFDLILNKYAGTGGGKIARFAFANICYQAGEFDRAIDLFQQSLTDFGTDGFYRKRIISGIGYAQAGKKDLKAAAATFETLSSEPGMPDDETLFQLGRFYEALGEAEKSRDAFRKIITDHPNSVYIPMVTEKLAG